MIAPATPKQADIDKRLEKEFGIKCLNQLTTDGTHKLYEDKSGKSLTLPSDVDGYSHFTYSQIVAMLNKTFPESVGQTCHAYGVNKHSANLTVVKKTGESD